jgi:hypothetical protein
VYILRKNEVRGNRNMKIRGEGEGYSSRSYLRFIIRVSKKTITQHEQSKVKSGGPYILSAMVKAQESRKSNHE